MESLEDFIGKTCGEGHFRVEQDLGQGFVRLKSGEADRRQAAQDIRCSEDVVLELLRNSLDAGAHRIFLATGKDQDVRRIVVIDDGAGIPDAMRDLIFEARVTSKLNDAHGDRWGFHGRGMALYSITQRTEQATVIDSAPELGSAIMVTVDASSLPEKTDQSTFPRLIPDEHGPWSMRGPKNILRIACEFQLEYQDRCSIYCGSVAEIAATLYRQGLAISTARDRATHGDYADLPIWLRPSYAADPAELATRCARLGLGISERTARRIIDGQLSPVTSLLELLRSSVADAHTPPKRQRATEKPRALRFEEDDRVHLGLTAASLVEALGERYYFRVTGEGSVRTLDDAITITIPIERE